MLPSFFGFSGLVSLLCERERMFFVSSRERVFFLCHKGRVRFFESYTPQKKETQVFDQEKLTF